MKGNEKEINARTIRYAAGETPPPKVLILSALQQMLLVISVSLALPVSVARVAGLDAVHSGSLLSAGLFGIGVCAIVQSLPGRFIGSGCQSFAACDFSTVAVMVLAAEKGGIPLVLGMTIFTALVHALFGSFASKMRRLFPAEVTGTMIFILGFSLLPTTMKYFLPGEGLGALHLIISLATLLFMILCTLFIKKLSLYTALLGVLFGYILSIATGYFDLSSFAELRDCSIVSLPFYKDVSFAFDPSLIVPCLILAIANGVVDNIGDFCALQHLNNPGSKKIDWHCVERGSRAQGIATALTALVGGSLAGTATANIGIAGATGILSRKVSYLGGAMLIALSFFPMLSGALSIIPAPVLGAVLFYCMAYILSNGFSMLQPYELDDRRIFTIFLSLAAGVSTMIPGLYDFLPESVSNVLATPMSMGVCVLLATSLLSRIGTRRTYRFVTGVSAEEVNALGEEIGGVCRRWGTKRFVTRNLEMSLAALCEGVYEDCPQARLHVEIRLDRLDLMLHVESENASLSKPEGDKAATALGIAFSLIGNMFDEVRVKWKDGNFIMDLDEDINSI